MLKTKTFASKILGKLSLYSPEFPAALCIYKTTDFGGFVGVYKNNDSDILFFEDAFMIISTSTYIIKYESVLKNLFPEDKTHVKGFFVLVDDSSQVWLPVVGHKDNKLFDAFGVMRFVDRVSKLKRS